MVNVSMASQRGRWLKVVYGMNVNAWEKKKITIAFRFILLSCGETGSLRTYK